MAISSNAFGELLRATRVAKGYSLRKFAELVDVSPTYLSQVEQGKVERPATEGRVRAMAGALGQDADDWVILAGRMPENLADIVRDEPAMPALLRAAKGLTAEQLRQLTEEARKKQSEGAE